MGDGGRGIEKWFNFYDFQKSNQFKLLKYAWKRFNNLFFFKMHHVFEPFTFAIKLLIKLANKINIK